MIRQFVLLCLIFCLISQPSFADPGKERRWRHRLHKRLTERFQDFLQQSVSPKEARRLGPVLLKSLQRIAKSDPSSESLQLFYCEFATAFAFAFREDEDPDTAADAYKQVYEQAAILLKTRFPRRFEIFRKGTEKQLCTVLEELEDSDAPAVFWYAFGRGMEINVRPDIELVAQIPRVRMLLEWVLTKDEKIFNGGPHLGLALLHSAFPKAAGGSPKKALEHFKAIDRLTDNRWLIAKIIRARYYSVSLQAELPVGATAKQRKAAGMRAWKDFYGTLEAIVEAPDDLWPTRNLYNAVAKSKARSMLKNADDWILVPADVENPYSEDEDED